jgi:hypothetical protein
MGLTFFHVVEEMLGRCDMVELKLMAMVAHKIWFRRNFVMHGGDFTYPHQVFREASNSLEEFRRITAQEYVARCPLQETTATPWKKPPTCSQT